jgi:hypothetical protein
MSRINLWAFLLVGISARSSPSWRTNVRKKTRWHKRNAVVNGEGVARPTQTLKTFDLRAKNPKQI